MTWTRARLAMVCSAVAAAAALPAAAPAAETQPAPPGTRAVLFVGNNWDGTADIVDPQTFQVLRRLNVVPDLQERLREVYPNPVRLGYFLGHPPARRRGPRPVRRRHVQLARRALTVYVSRPSLADVVGIDLRTQKIVWRVPMDRPARRPHGDLARRHAAARLGLDRRNVVHVIDPQAGRKVGEFPSGDSPHESNYSKDGKPDLPREHRARLHAGRPAGRRLDEGRPLVPGRRRQDATRSSSAWTSARSSPRNGYPDYSSAVRPMAISPDEKTAYFQLSFLHGFVEFDLDERQAAADRRRCRSATRRPRHAARGVPARLRAPRPGDEPRRHEALRGRDDVGLRGDRVARDLRATR